MVDSGVPNSKDVEQLMLNAQLRSELEPFVDESFDLLDWQRMTTAYENEYLARRAPEPQPTHISIHHFHPLAH